MIIGEWLQKSGKRSSTIVITKCGAPSSPLKGLKAEAIEKSCEASLKRLKIETIDLYLSHFPDSETPYEETLGAFERLKKAGKIRWGGTSNLQRRAVEGLTRGGQIRRRATLRSAAAGVQPL